MSEVFGPYSSLRRAGNLFFISGQVGVASKNADAPQGISEQTKQALANLTAVLADNELMLSDVVKTTVFLKDMQDFAAMNAVYEAVFAAPRPARVAVAVADLPHIGSVELLVEIEAVACKSGENA